MSLRKQIMAAVQNEFPLFANLKTVRDHYLQLRAILDVPELSEYECTIFRAALKTRGVDLLAMARAEARARETTRPAASVPLPKPLVTVKYLALQPGFATLAPRALYNVVDGHKDLIGSTVTLESLFAKGYEVKEAA